MHIPDGILPTSVCLAGYAATGVATWASLRKINQKEDPRESIPKASLLTAAFFVASWIHIPIPPTSVHLVLNGLYEQSDRVYKAMSLRGYGQAQGKESFKEEFQDYSLSPALLVFVLLAAVLLAAMEVCL